MLNRALLVGRLTRDPELRRTGSGKAVTSFNLAVERNFKSDDQEADFINCVCWGKRRHKLKTNRKSKGLFSSSPERRLIFVFHFICTGDSDLFIFYF